MAFCVVDEYENITNESFTEHVILISSMSSFVNIENILFENKY